MQKIDHPTATPAGEFSPGDPDSGQLPTVVTAEWLNTTQRELVNLVEAAGISLDPNTDNQVLNAVLALTSGTGAADTPNLMLNAGLTSAQRGTVVAFDSDEQGYTLDRWRVSHGAFGSPPTTGQVTVSRRPISGTYATGVAAQMARIPFCLAIHDDLGGSPEVVLEHRIEKPGRVSGEVLTLSFYAHKLFGGSNQFSLEVVLREDNGNADTTLLSTAVNLTSATWQRFEFTTATMPVLDPGDVAALGTNAHLAVRLVWESGIGTTVNAEPEFAGFQLELGDEATRLAILPPELDLLLCQRFYETSTPNTVRFNALGAAEFTEVTGLANPIEGLTGCRRWIANGAGNVEEELVRFRVEKRVVPQMRVFPADPSTALQFNLVNVTNPPGFVQVQQIRQPSTAGFAGVELVSAWADLAVVSYRWEADAEL